MLPDTEPTWTAPSAGGQMAGVQAGLAVSQGCEVRCVERMMQISNTVEGSGKDCWDDLERCSNSAWVLTELLLWGYEL